MNRLLLAMVVLALCGVAAAAHAESIVVNGDFENLTGWGNVGTTQNPANWPAYQSPRLNPAAKQSGANAIGGSGTSAYMPAFFTADANLRRDMANTLTPPTDTVFTYALDFASEDPGDAAADRSVAAAMYLATASSTARTITFRVVDGTTGDGLGDLQFLGASSTYYTVLAGAVTFDDNVEVTPLVNHFSLTGHFDGTNKYYDVAVTDAGGTTRTATNLAYFGSSTAITGLMLNKITFNTFNSLGDYLLDNVTVPEPSAALLLTLGLSSLAAFRRRK